MESAEGIRMVRHTFRRLDPADYPELRGVSWDEAYGHGDNMAPGGLYLAAVLARSLDLTPGARVLDVGCGRGDSSLYLAERLGARVVCFDLWIGATWLQKKMEVRGRSGSVLPMDLDARHPLPLPDDSFDAVFCMQSLHTFGTDPGVLRKLLRHLRPGGLVVVGGTCFDREPGVDGLPPVYRRTDGWSADYDAYHSPGWWREVFERTRLVEVIDSRELPDGLVMWEDEVLHHGETAGWDDGWWEKAGWLVEQLLWSRTGTPRLTHYVLTAKKRS